VSYLDKSHPSRLVLLSNPIYYYSSDSFSSSFHSVIITNNSINDKHTSRTNQLRDIPDYLFNDMVDFIITLEKNDISDIVNLIHIKCILRPPWYQIDERGNRNDLVSGIIDLSSFETYSL
jgi:hypothetical protein